MQHVRIFAAVNVSIATIRRLAELQRELRDSQDPTLKVRWVPTPNIHVTVKFYGNIQLEGVEAVCDAVGQAAVRVEPFELKTAGLGVFPNPHRPRVLWVGLTDPTDGMERLRQAIEETSERLGFTRDERNYRPHLTLGRIKQGAGGVADWLETHQDVDCLVSTVQEVVLYESRLSRKGAEYVAHCRAPLGSAPGR